MLIPMAGEGPISYKSYKNQTFDKCQNRMNNLLEGIRSNSLKKEDKIKLLNILGDLLINEKSKLCI
jgi:hypothetical protein